MFERIHETELGKNIIKNHDSSKKEIGLLNSLRF